MENKILVTGGSGLVGSYLKNILPEAIYVSSKDFNLTLENDVIKMFNMYNPSIVVHLAARVGGIIDNINYPADFLRENTLMNTLMIEHSRLFGVKKFIGVLSTCIYPDVSDTYPLEEFMLHNGPPTKTNFTYAYSKRLMATQIDAYNQQYNLKYQYLIPCNLYGIGDKDNEDKSHFLTALIKKIYYANKNNLNEITLFGDGTPLRQFMYANDFAKIIKEIIEKNITSSFNVATNENISIIEMSKLALKTTKNEKMKIIWDKSKPNGQYRKDVSTKLFKNIFPNFTFTSLEEGIKLIYNSYYDKISK